MCAASYRILQELEVRCGLSLDWLNLYGLLSDFTRTEERKSIS